MTRKTFIHHDGALGDVLLSLACLRAVRESSDFVHLAGPPAVTEVLKETGFVHETSPAGNTLFTSLYTREIERGTVDFLQQFDHAVLFTRQRESLLAINLTKVISDINIIVTIPPHGVGSHVAEFRLSQLARAATSDATPLGINIPLRCREEGRKLLVRFFGNEGWERLIAFHPGSGGKRKCWPLVNYFELAERLHRLHTCRILFLTGPSEEPEVADYVQDFADRHAGMAHIRNQPLITVACLLAESRLYVGNDSGVTHLAASVNAEVIAIFGPTAPTLWKPLGTRVHVISGGISEHSLAELSVEQVHERLIPILQERSKRSAQ
ncbi:MAG TPA: glycosyltransferase family 9 protein [Thermodesulfovibrionales bacterium]|nr:glycosyltransferase family 9 protein [Thermodesulfovibrionales bacterium]